MLSVWTFPRLSTVNEVSGRAGLRAQPAISRHNRSGAGRTGTCKVMLPYLGTIAALSSSFLVKSAIWMQ